MVVRHCHPGTHPPDHLSNLDTGSDAALCTDSMVVGENKSLIIMSRIISDKLESCIMESFYKNTSIGLNQRAV